MRTAGGLSLALHLLLIVGLAGFEAEPLPPTPVASTLGDEHAARLSVLLLTRDEAPPSMAPPPMPQPPPRPQPAEHAALPAAPSALPTPPTEARRPWPAAAEPAAPPASPPAPSPLPSVMARENSPSPPTAASTAAAPARTAGPVGDRRAQQRYLQDLMAWLARHRTYPDAAKKAKLQGVVHVRFTLDRHGRLLAAGIDRGPGIALLEQAAMDVLQRASPMPPIPESMGISKLTLTLPIEYSLLTD